MRKTYWLIVLFVCLASSVSAQVNFKDTWNPKPRYVPLLSKPNEATAPKYWIDFTSGSGTTCSQSAPCRTLRDLLGKPGMAGGPAIVYIKGTGSGVFHMYGTAGIRGSGNGDCFAAGSQCGSWILIRPWPAGSPGCAVECTARITGTNSWRGVNMTHIMLDGGPDLKIEWRATVTGSFEYVWQVNSDWIIAHRNDVACNSISSTARLWAWGNGGVSDNVKAVNNEFHGCNNDTGSATGAQISAIYAGPSDGGGWNNFWFAYNIVRHMSGDGVEFNARATSSGAVVEGNLFHHNGRGTCADRSGWNCRPHVTFHSQNGNPVSGSIVRNNFGAISGSGCVYTRVSGIQVLNNTFTDWAQNNHESGTIDNPTCLVDSAGNTTVRGNIMASANGANPFDSASYSASFNACLASESCGTSKITWPGPSGFVSTDPNDTDHLKLAPSSPAIDSSTPTSATTDFFGTARPQGAAFDVGAHESGDGPSDPVDCQVSAWTDWIPQGDWSVCTTGTQTRVEQRTRTVTQQPSGGGQACPALSETRTVSQSCEIVPIDCQVSAWSAWQPIGEWSTCSNGAQSRMEQRTRTIVIPPANGGAACPDLSETQTVSQSCTDPLPVQAPSVAVTGCSFQLTAQPPTTQTGWAAQFRRGSINVGSLDTSAPFSRTTTVSPGNYSFTVVWTRTGSASVTSPALTVTCQ